MPRDFAHLHLHTEYSFLDGFSKVWDSAAKEKGVLIKRLEELGHKYCAITDHGSTAGWVRFDKACKAGGIKPIFGVEGYFCNDRRIKGLADVDKLRAHRGLTNAKDKRAATKAMEAKLGLNRRSHFVALAMNETGIIEIQKSLSVAATEGLYFRPRWDFDMIQQMKNCIFLTGCHGGFLNYWLHQFPDLTDKERMAKASWELERWKKALGDRLYLETMAIDWPTQGMADRNIIKLAKAYDVPWVITNDSHYVYPEDWEGHDILLALQSSKWDKGSLGKDILNDPNRMRYSMRDLYVKNRAQMFASFRRHHKYVKKGAVSRALDLTSEVAARCHHNIIKKPMIMPVLKVPNVKSAKHQDKPKGDRYLLYLVQKGWKKKIVPYVEEKYWKKYKKRLNEEIRMITGQGFTPYFILCNRLMEWSDSVGIARGPARGSSAGSLVAYLLDITMVDPIPHKLLFSR